MILSVKNLGKSLHTSVFGDLSHIILTSCLLLLGPEKWYFLLIFSTIYADVGGLVGPKKTKNMLT